MLVRRQNWRWCPTKPPWSTFNLIKGLGPVLQIAEVVTATLPDHVHDKLDKRTSETARPRARMREHSKSAVRA